MATAAAAAALTQRQPMSGEYAGGAYGIGWRHGMMGSAVLEDSTGSRASGVRRGVSPARPSSRGGRA